MVVAAGVRGAPVRLTKVTISSIFGQPLPFSM